MAKKIEPSSIVTAPPGGIIMYGESEVGASKDIISALAESVEALRTPSTTDIKAGYMVSVDGNSSPKRIHATIEEAKAEAERISTSQQGKIIRIVYLVGVYEPSHKFRELV